MHPERRTVDTDEQALRLPRVHTARRSALIPPIHDRGLPPRFFMRDHRRATPGSGSRMARIEVPMPRMGPQMTRVDVPMPRRDA
ncbi:MAG TPA: hypothetical protein PKH44_10180, partial [Plasticicumulans sp.]|nr:hypothetical protein [Plasticicumulans sp.]